MDLLNKVVDNFAKLNKNMWPEMKKCKQKILVEGFLDIPSYLVGVATIARAINNVKNYEPIVLTSNNLTKNNEVKKIFNSYGIKNYIVIKRHRFNIFIILKAVIATLNVYIGFSNLDMFINYKLNDTKIGDLIYDTYIRQNNRYSKIKLWSLSFFKELIKSHFKFYLYTHFIKKYNFKYIILSHNCYVNGGMLARIGSKHGSKVLTSASTCVRCFHDYNEIISHILKPSKGIIKLIINKQLYKKTDGFLKERFAGNIEQQAVIDAYKNKKRYSSDELYKKLSLNPSYSTVFIMSHAFSDGPHTNGNILFRDYYQWFIETIKFINNIRNINWVVKPHPCSYMYNETGEVEQLVIELKLNNIHLAPSDLSTASVLNMSKTVVTVSGTIGIEAACLGIKPIIAGEAPYSDFGIAYEPKNKLEYFSILKNMNSISSLNEKEIIIAKSIFYWYFVGAFPNSTIVPKKGVYTSTDPKIIDEQKIENCKNIIENLKNNNPKNDPYYIHLKKMIKEDKKYLTTIW